MTKLNLEIIESYNLPAHNYRPDYDDAGYIFTLPSGIELSGLHMCNGRSIIMNMLEGLDGYIIIETEEELKELISLSYEQTLQKIKSEFEDFKIEDYI